jgi:hypothetical protein
VRDPFLRRLFLEQGHVTEPRIREHGRELIDSFGVLAVAELTRLTEIGEASCTDPEAVAVLIRTATAGWIAEHASGNATVDHERLLDVVIAAVRALIRPIATAKGSVTSPVRAAGKRQRQRTRR